jgi:hypothetical protein
MSSDFPVVERALAQFDDSDLRRLADLARKDREEFFKTRPPSHPSLNWGQLYATRVLSVALCQGAAKHYVDGTTGVKDLDVWTFYAKHQTLPFPSRRIKSDDFGPSHFGRHPAEVEFADKRQFTGRRVDFLGRSIKCAEGTDPIDAVRDYLASGKTDSARKLAEKAVVVLEPAELRGRIIWPRPADQPNRLR